MNRSLAIGLLACAAAFAGAAPVPKKKAVGADLSGVHALIAKRAENGKWSEEDGGFVKTALQSLLENVAEATGDPAWIPPVDLDSSKTVFVKGPVEIKKPGVYLIAGDVTDVEAENCLILATGQVVGGFLENVVVVAKDVQSGSAKNSLLVAAETVLGNSIGHPKTPGCECVVVAGKRIETISAYGGVFHVIAPELPDDTKAKIPVSARRVERGARLLVEPIGRAVGDKNFKLVELKAAIAK